MIHYVAHDKLKKCLEVLHSLDIPTAIIGGVGTGKTDSVVQFAEDKRKKDGDFNLWKVFLGMIPPSDIGGIPVKDDFTGDIRFAPPSYLPFNTEERGIIFGDEFDRSQPDTQNAFTQVLLGKEIHGNHVSPNAYIVLAMNGVGDNYTTALSKAIRTRVCSLFVKSNENAEISSWDKWAVANDVNDVVRTYKKLNPISDEVDYEELAMATNRTLVMAGKVIDYVDANPDYEDVLVPIVAGLIGSGASAELLSVRKLKEDLPDIKKILINPDSLDKALLVRADICYLIVDSIANNVRDAEEQADKIFQLLSMFPPEIALMGSVVLSKKFPEIVATTAYAKFFVKYKKFLM